MNETGSTSTDAVITLQELRKEYVQGRDRITALHDVDLAIPKDEFTVILGPSGCGKSTLLRLLAGFEKPTEGVIRIHGHNIKKPGPDRGFVFQDFALFPWLTVKRNIMFGLTHTGKDRAEAERLALEAIERIGLREFENAYPHMLSGGMKQRVGIARALAYEPEVVLMDEPFGALDAQTRKYMQGELIRIWEHSRPNIVFVTHSVIEAIYLADRICVMTARPGRIKETIEITLPRPRDYSSEAFLDIRKRILDLLDIEVKRSMRQHTPLDRHSNTTQPQPSRWRRLRLKL